jgi:hypothetical protein
VFEIQSILRMKRIASQLACQSVINTTRTAWGPSSFMAHEHARDWIHDITIRKRLPMTVVPLHKPAVVYQRKLFAPLRSASQARLPLPFAEARRAMHQHTRRWLLQCLPDLVKLRGQLVIVLLGVDRRWRRGLQAVSRVRQGCQVPHRATEGK